MSDDEYINYSILWVKNKTNHKSIVQKIVMSVNESPTPFSVFMAGSPGAGKTETAKPFLELSNSMISIDPDILRNLIPGYNPSRSELTNSAVSILVEKIQDLALEKRRSFVLDGTLSNYDKAEKNIKRSLGRKRKVMVIYVHLDPLKAWEFTQKRELVEGRNIPKEAFIQQYFNSKNVVSRLKDEFGSNIEIFLIDRSKDKYLVAQNKETIDNFTSNKYTLESLKKLL